MQTRLAWIAVTLAVAGCAAPKPVEQVAAPQMDPQDAYHQCAAESAAATAGLTSRKGLAASRLFSQCMAAKAPNDPAAQN